MATEDNKLPINEALIIECDYCYEDIVEGEPHECLVVGTTISIERLPLEEE